MESVTSSPEKEKKRKKLDQIVMGLCAAKGGNSALGKGGNEDQAERCKSPWGSVSRKEEKEKGKNVGDAGRSSVTITPIPQSRSSSEHLKMESKEAKVRKLVFVFTSWGLLLAKCSLNTWISKVFSPFASSWHEFISLLLYLFSKSKDILVVVGHHEFYKLINVALTS